MALPFLVSCTDASETAVEDIREGLMVVNQFLLATFLLRDRSKNEVKVTENQQFCKVKQCLLQKKKIT